MAVACRNPFRPADWVWQRAQSIVDGTGPRASRVRDTEQGFAWIRDTVRFIREFNACTTDIALASLAERKGDFFWAHWAYTHDEQRSQRYAIESHILARGDNFEIAYRCGTTPNMVETYERVFFNVRDKLHHPQYIVNCVMGPAIHRTLQERDYDLLWKLYGYFVGPHVLDALQTKFSTPTWCGTPDGVSAAILDDAIGTLKLKAALAAKTVPVNQQTQLALLEAFTKFVEVERTTDSAGKAQEQILDHIHSMMTSIPFNVGGRDPRSNDAIMDRGALGPFEQSAVELTYEETMRVSVRRPIANEETLRALAFPNRPTVDALEVKETAQ